MRYFEFDAAKYFLSHQDFLTLEMIYNSPHRKKMVYNCGVHTVLTVPTPRAPNETIKSSPECCGSKVDYRDSVPVTRDSTAGQCNTLSPLLQSPPRGTSHLNETLPRYHNAGYDVTNLLSFPCEFLLLDTQPLQNMVRLKFMRSCFVLLHCLKGGKIICSRKTWLAGSGYK